MIIMRGVFSSSSMIAGRKTGVQRPRTDLEIAQTRAWTCGVSTILSRFRRFPTVFSIEPTMAGGLRVWKSIEKSEASCWRVEFDDFVELQISSAFTWAIATFDQRPTSLQADVVFSFCKELGCCKELGQAMDPDNQQKCIVTKPKNAPNDRITLTFSTISKAKNLILHMRGSSKLQTFELAMTLKDAKKMPIYAFTEQPLAIYWSP